MLTGKCSVRGEKENNNLSLKLKSSTTSSRILYFTLIAVSCPGSWLNNILFHKDQIQKMLHNLNMLRF